MAETQELDRLLTQVRRIEQSREKGAEAEIRKTYKALMEDLQHDIADAYGRYAEDDILDYDILQRNGYYARFLEEVEQRVDGISPAVRQQIRQTVEQTYAAAYNGMVEAVKRAAGAELAGLAACTPEIIRRAVENPISGLTLNDRLNKHRREIIYNIKQNISVGLLNGDRYSTMARRIKESLNGDYKKAIRIVRTETHRVREAGNHDAAASANSALHESGTGRTMIKTWKTMKDERVRPAAKKGKKSKKGGRKKSKGLIGRAKLYDHRSMEGVELPVDEEFELPSGARTMAPGQSGIAGEDINCRCYLSYRLAEDSLGKGLHAGNGNDGIPSHPAPEHIDTVDINNRRAVESKLKEYEALIANEPVENAIVITRNGNVVRCRGDLNGVYPDVDLGDDLIGAHMTHNHPIGSNNEYSFSELDIAMFDKYKLKTLRGIDEKYIYELTSGARTRDKRRSIFELTEFDGAHDRNIGIAEQLGVGYRRWKR